MTEPDKRRQAPIRIVWNEKGTAAELFIASDQRSNADRDGALRFRTDDACDELLWAEVEWSVKHKRWCIQDGQGRCLTHKASIHAQTESKAEAIALAEAMIRDGSMPSPEAARAARQERLRADREKRSKQPAEIRRRAERAEGDRLFKVRSEAEWAMRKAEQSQPLYEVFADAYDLTDPALWKSNSFAQLRDRLVTMVRTAIADLESDVHHHKTDLYQRKLRRSEHSRAYAAVLAKRLARAREILTLLTNDYTPMTTEGGLP
jgi:hypothetical protein